MDCTQWASIIFSQTSVTSAVILKNDNKLTLAKRLTLCTSLHSTNKEKNQFDVTQLLSDANSTYIYNEMDFFFLARSQIRPYFNESEQFNGE